jgi:hypothetical protein
MEFALTNTGGRQISADEAETRDIKRAKCADCGQEVVWHRKGTTGQKAHFEHMPHSGPYVPRKKV